MYKYFTLIVCCVVTLNASAQTPQAAIQSVMPFGKVDQADMELKKCDFEPDANAEILFDKGKMNDHFQMERHIRIKIFNDFGKSGSNVRISYPTLGSNGGVIDLQAETINSENGKIVVTPLDKKQIFIEKVNKVTSALVFAFPSVRPGSIIEYKYRIFGTTTWYFQNSLPTRYSEIQTDFPGGSELRAIPHIKQPFVKNVGQPTDFVQDKALADVHSLPDEPFMSSRTSNLQRIDFLGGINELNTWTKICEILLKYTDFTDDLNRSVAGEAAIVTQAKALKTDDEKISYIFDEVKNNMKWNDNLSFLSEDGTARAWDKKTGNSAEINFIIYHLLKRAGIKSYPMLVGSKNNGKVNPANPNLFVLTNVIIYVPVDTAKYYVLDGTDKFNLYNAVPTEHLNTFGLRIDEAKKEYKMYFLENEDPAMQSVFLNAAVKSEGKMDGTVELTSYSYNKIKATEKYKTDGESKYISYLTNNDNSLKLSSIKMENMLTDTLPLIQKANFAVDLTSSDGNYIIFNTNLFNSMGANPFITENRYSDIDFGYADNYSVNGLYKLPAGYKTDALPKTITIVMPDQSIVFKRTVVEDNGTILVRYTLNHRKVLYFSADYQDLRGFYKKMYELLSEQVVLKKL